MPTKKTTAIEKVKPKAGEIVLNLDSVRKYIAPTATSKECEAFLNLCVIWDLNPFKREIYFIKYDSKRPPAVVVGYEVYLKRAERQKMLKGWKAWTEEEGETMKACIEIHRADWDQPFYHEVYWDEYAQYKTDYRTGKKVLTKFWREKGRTMLKKVVIGQGFRMCFPDEMGGMPYTSEEMPEALPTELIRAPVAPLGYIAEVEDTSPAPKEKPTPPDPKVIEKPEPEPKKPEKAKPKRKPSLSTVKKPTSLIPDVPPDLLDDEPPKEGISKEEYERLKEKEAKMDNENADVLADISGDESEPEEDGSDIAMRNAIEQKLNLLNKHFGRDKVKLVEKIHLVLSNKFGVTVAKFPDDLSTEQLTYTLELLQVTIDNEEKKKEKK